jgi:hypothetical protein
MGLAGFLCCHVGPAGHEFPPTYGVMNYCTFSAFVLPNLGRVITIHPKRTEHHLSILTKEKKNEETPNRII